MSNGVVSEMRLLLAAPLSVCYVSRLYHVGWGMQCPSALREHHGCTLPRGYHPVPRGVW